MDRAKPITDAMDPRLLGLMNLALMPQRFPDWMLVEYAWARSYCDQGRMDLFVARAQMEIPFPRRVWSALDRRTMEELDNRALAWHSAQACGFTMGEFLGACGIKRVDNNSFPHFCAIALAGVRLQEKRPVIESWTRYRAEADRHVAEAEER